MLGVELGAGGIGPPARLGAAPQHDDPAAAVAFAAVGRGAIPGTEDIEGPVRPTVPIADRATGLLRFGIGGLGAAIGAASPSGVELVAGVGPDADGGNGGFMFIGFMVPFCSDMRRAAWALVDQADGVLIDSD